MYLDSEGKQRTKNFLTLKQAQAFQGDVGLKKSKSVRIDPVSGRIIVVEFWGHFMTTVAIRPSTRALYETHGSLYILPPLGKEAAAVRDDGRYQGDAGGHPGSRQERSDR